ncbi:hypothetical protein VNI00_016140 [Paramarasmius palmivorus]|uniref:Uncharacterized protein n=1 Tax=Paramarasmius palmivorus TaxID=297713 RepID=A0AAW0BFF7_9AGAR
MKAVLEGQRTGSPFLTQHIFDDIDKAQEVNGKKTGNAFFGADLPGNYILCAYQGASDLFLAAQSDVISVSRLDVLSSASSLASSTTSGSSELSLDTATKIPTIPSRTTATTASTDITNSKPTEPTKTPLEFESMTSSRADTGDTGTPTIIKSTPTTQSSTSHNPTKSATSSISPTNSVASSPKYSSGVTAGLVVGVLFLVLALCGGILLYLRQRLRKGRTKSMSPYVHSSTVEKLPRKDRINWGSSTPESAVDASTAAQDEGREEHVEEEESREQVVVYHDDGGWRPQLQARGLTVLEMPPRYDSAL